MIPGTHHGHGLDFVVHVCLSGGTMSVHTVHGERGKEGECFMYRCACLVPLILWF